MRSCWFIGLVLVYVSCTSPPETVFRIRDSKLEVAVVELVRQNSVYFTSAYNIVVVVDNRSCTKSLAETVWWLSWQRSAAERGVGFVFATCRPDSTDLDIAVGLEGLQTPILVFPMVKQDLSELGIPPGALPLKLLIDSEHKIVRAWGPVADTTQSRQLQRYIQALEQTE